MQTGHHRRNTTEWSAWKQSWEMRRVSWFAGAVVVLHVGEAGQLGAEPEDPSAVSNSARTARVRRAA